IGSCRRQELGLARCDLQGMSEIERCGHRCCQEPAVLQLEHNRTAPSATRRRLLQPGYKSKQETHKLLCSGRTVQSEYFSQPTKGNGVKGRKGARGRFCWFPTTGKRFPKKETPAALLFASSLRSLQWSSLVAAVVSRTGVKELRRR